MSDFNYSKGADGFVAIYPNTPQAVAMFAKVVEVAGPRLMPNEFKAFAAQARKAGYSVHISKPETSISDGELMAVLG